MPTTVTPLVAAVLNTLIANGIEASDMVSFLQPIPSPAPTPQPVPTPAPTPSQAATFGINLAGSLGTASDPATHPAYLSTLAQFGCKIVRVWFSSMLAGTMPDAEFNVPRKFAAAGYDVCGVINFQNSVIRLAAPGAAEWLTYINSFPTAAASGVKYLEIGNEIDTATYYSGTVAQYAALMAAAYPLLKAKGYIVICSNTYYSTPWPSALQQAGVMNNCDFVGRHPYETTAANSLADIQKCITFAASVGKGVLITEGGIDGNADDLAGWAAQVELLIAGVKKLPIIFIYFSMNQQSQSKAGPEGLLTATDMPNTLFTNAFGAGLEA